MKRSPYREITFPWLRDALAGLGFVMFLIAVWLLLDLAERAHLNELIWRVFQ